MAAAASSHSPEDSLNYDRLNVLLVDVGATVLRQLLKTYLNIPHTSLDSHLLKHEPELQKLKKKYILNQEQMDLLFPPTGTADIEQFDMTLLNSLLRNIVPRIPINDHKEIDNLRKYRNSVLGHASQAAVNDIAFNQLWCKIESSLKNLASVVSDTTFQATVHTAIQEVKSNPNVLRPLREILVQWHKQDIDISQTLETVSEGQKEIMGKIDDTTDKIDALTEGRDDLKKVLKEGQDKLRKSLKESYDDVKKTLEKRHDNVNLIHQTSEETAVKVDELSESVKHLREHVQQEKSPFENMKEQTAMYLETNLTIGFVQTSQMEEAKDMLKLKGSVVVSGRPGEGKTTVCAVLMKSNAMSGQCLMLDNASDLRYVDLGKVHTIMVDDIFGSYKLDKDRLKKWLRVLPKLQACATSRNLKIIISSRKDILAEAELHIDKSKLKMFRHTVELNSENLNSDEKKEILKSFLVKSNEKSITDEEIKRCVQAFECQLGFPYCCHLFTLEPDLLKQKAKFFRQPYNAVIGNMKAISNVKRVSLACLFSNNGRLDSSDFEKAEKNKRLKLLVTDMLDKTRNSSVELSLTNVRAALEAMCGVYVEKYEEIFRFAHNIIYEAEGIILADYNQEHVIKVCSLDFLCQRLCVEEEANSDDDFQHHICVRKDNYRCLAERLIDEVVIYNNNDRIALHPVLLNKAFAAEFVHILKEKNLLEDFFKQKKQHHSQSVLIQLLERKGMEAKSIIEGCMDALACCHTIPEQADPDKCWKCKQKQKALDESFKTNNVGLTQMLLGKGAVSSYKGLLFSVFHSNLHGVRTSIEHLKVTNKWSGQEAQWILERAFKENNEKIKKKLLSEGVELSPKCVVSAADSGDINNLKDAIHRLKDCNKWDTNHKEVLKTLELSYTQKKNDVRKILLHEGVPVSPKCLKGSIIHGNVSDVKEAIENLKINGKWKPNDKEISAVISETYNPTKTELNIMLKEEGVVFIQRLLADIESGDKEEFRKRLNSINSSTHKWEPNESYAAQAFRKTFESQQNEIRTMIIDKGVSTKFIDIAYEYKDMDSVRQLINLLKHLGSWDPTDKYALKLLLKAYGNGDTEFVDLLHAENVEISEECLIHALIPESTELVKKAIVLLKEANKWHPERSTVIKSVFESSKDLRNPQINTVLEEEGCDYDLMFNSDFVGDVLSVSPPGLVSQISFEENVEAEVRDSRELTVAPTASVSNTTESERSQDAFSPVSLARYMCFHIVLLLFVILVFHVLNIFISDV